MWPATPRRGKWGLAGEARTRTKILRLSYACYILECLSLKIQFVVLRVRGGLSWSGLVFMVVTRSSLVHCCWRLSFKMPLVWKSAYNFETLALEQTKRKWTCVYMVHFDATRIKTIWDQLTLKSNSRNSGETPLSVHLGWVALLKQIIKAPGPLVAELSQLRHITFKYQYLY